MHQLSDFFDAAQKNGKFKQTQFVNSDQPDSVCFVGASRYVQIANENPAITCVVTTPELAKEIEQSKGLVVVDSAEETFYRLHNLLCEQQQMRPALNPGIAETAKIHPRAYVDEYVEIGEDVEIDVGAVVLSGTVLEDGVRIGPNAVIGAEGHFFKRFPSELFCVKHAGGVRLRRGVHVLAGAVVSKALHSNFTEIGEQSVVSVHAHIAHGCSIGSRTIIAGNSQIAGYTSVGNNVWIAPSVTVGNLREIGDDAKLEIGSVVIEDIDKGERVSGNFAVPHARNMFSHVRRKKG